MDKISSSEDDLIKKMTEMFKRLSDDKKQQAVDFLRYLEESQENR
jgi:hypothetical protein